jgi:uncharacterized membrane protein
MQLSNSKLFQRERKIGEPAVVVGQLLKILGVKFTSTHIDNFKNDPEYGTLLSLEDFLSEYGISTLSTKIPAESLSEIPYPAIAHLHKNGGSYTVLTGFKNNEVHYLDTNSLASTIPLSEFQKKWLGVTLLVESNENAKEPEYEQNRKIESFSLTSKYISIALSALLVLSFIFYQKNVFVIIALHFAGLFISTLLLLKEQGNVNSLVSKICRKGKNSDCDAVINSPKAKIFGTISLSEIGILYFVGSISYILMQITSKIDFTYPFLLSIASLPFSLISIWLQGKVLKKWCPLCVTILIILWLEFAILFTEFDGWVFTANEFYLLFVSFSLSLIGWLVFREILFNSLKVKHLEKSLARFTRSEEIFLKLLEKQPQMAIGSFTKELYHGNQEAPVEITIVSSPVCTPCFAAHRVIEEIIKRFSDSVTVKYRFSIPTNANTISYQVINHFAHKLLVDEKSEVLSAVNAWYDQGHDINFLNWKDRFPASQDVESDQIREIVMEHQSWCSQSGIMSTPTIFINGKKLPEPFTVSDLAFQIRKLIAKVQEV